MATRSKPFFICAMFAVGATLISSPLLANTQQSTMEVITVTYQTSVHYAVNQHLTESISRFHTERYEMIKRDARNQIQQMANEFSISSLDNADIAYAVPHPITADNYATHH